LNSWWPWEKIVESVQAAGDSTNLMFLSSNGVTPMTLQEGNTSREPQPRLGQGWNHHLSHANRFGSACRVGWRFQGQDGDPARVPGRGRSLKASATGGTEKKRNGHLCEKRTSGRVQGKGTRKVHPCKRGGLVQTERIWHRGTPERGPRESQAKSTVN